MNEQLAKRTIEHLSRVPAIKATWEYPGFIAIRHERFASVNFAVGDADGPIGMDMNSDDGESLGSWELTTKHFESGVIVAGWVIGIIEDVSTSIMCGPNVAPQVDITV